MHRMMNTPGTAENALRELFWNAGPQRVQAAFAGFLRDRVDEGRLRIDDVALAASQFFCLLKGELHPMMACGLCNEPRADDVARHTRCQRGLVPARIWPLNPPGAAGGPPHRRWR